MPWRAARGGFLSVLVLSVVAAISAPGDHTAVAASHDSTATSYRNGVNNRDGALMGTPAGGSAVEAGKVAFEGSAEERHGKGSTVTGLASSRTTATGDADSGVTPGSGWRRLPERHSGSLRSTTNAAAVAAQRKLTTNLAVRQASAGGRELVQSRKVSYTYFCEDSGPTTVQVDDMTCGCLDQRKQLVRTVACFESDLIEAAIQNCVDCSHRTDCNCTLKALGLSTGGPQRFNTSLVNINNYCGLTYNAALKREFQCLDGTTEACPEGWGCYDVGPLPDDTAVQSGGGEPGENIKGVPPSFSWWQYLLVFLGIMCAMGIATSVQELVRRCNEDDSTTQSERRHRRHSKDRLHHRRHDDDSDSSGSGSARQSRRGKSRGKSRRGSAHRSQHHGSGRSTVNKHIHVASVRGSGETELMSSHESLSPFMGVTPGPGAMPMMPGPMAPGPMPPGPMPPGWTGPPMAGAGPVAPPPGMMMMGPPVAGSGSVHPEMIQPQR